MTVARIICCDGKCILADTDKGCILNDPVHDDDLKKADKIIALTPVVAREPVQANTEQVHGQGDHLSREKAESDALQLLLTAALLMPRATPKAGGATTAHTFKIEAASVWALDEACKAADRVLAASRRASLIANQNDLRGCQPETVAREPVGWPPREPTEEMLVAAREWSRGKYGKPIGNDAAKGCWQTMLDASLPPASAVREALEEAKAALIKIRASHGNVAQALKTIDRALSLKETDQ